MPAQRPAIPEPIPPPPSAPPERFPRDPRDPRASMYFLFYISILFSITSIIPSIIANSLQAETVRPQLVTKFDLKKKLLGQYFFRPKNESRPYVKVEVVSQRSTSARRK